jgi:hypothetical protein
MSAPPALPASHRLLRPQGPVRGLRRATLLGNYPFGTSGTGNGSVGFKVCPKPHRLPAHPGTVHRRRHRIVTVHAGMPRTQSRSPPRPSPAHGRLCAAERPRRHTPRATPRSFPQVRLRDTSGLVTCDRAQRITPCARPLSSPSPIRLPALRAGRDRRRLLILLLTRELVRRRH